MNFNERLYFAYGSNLHRKQMAWRCPTAVPVRAFHLKNWTLVFRAVADIVPRVGGVVGGGLYRVTDADITALDRYEGVSHGLYRRVPFRITKTGERGFFYVMNEDETCPPDKHYLATIEEGYRNWKLPMRTLRAAQLEHSSPKIGFPVAHREIG